MPQKGNQKLRLSIRAIIYGCLLTGLTLGLYQGVFMHFFKATTQPDQETLAYAMNGEPLSSIQQKEWSTFNLFMAKAKEKSSQEDTSLVSSTSLPKSIEKNELAGENTTVENSQAESMESRDELLSSLQSNPDQTNESAPIEYTKTVLIDAGHGGIDLGETALDGTMEKDITLNLAKKIKKHLEAANPNLQILMIRESDQLNTDGNKTGWEDLVWRRKQQEAANADYFLSIHACSSKDEAGYSFYLNPDDSVSSIWVNTMQDNLQQDGWGSARAIITTDQYPLQLISMASSHAVQIDLGTLSDAQNLERLKSDSNLEQAAAAIASAISTTIQENPEAPDYVSRQEIIEQKTWGLQ